MNSVVWHIIKKDLRRFRLLLALWVAALLVRVCIAGWTEQNYAPESGLGILAFMLVLLLNAHLVVSVLGEDSPVKEAAFWRTRPIAGRQMMSAKLLFLAGWTLVLPMAVVAVAGWSYGFTARECAAVAAGQLIVHGLIGGIFLLVSLFTQRVWATILGLGLVLILAQVFLMRVAVMHVMRSSGAIAPAVIEFEPASLELSRMVIAVVVLLVACGTAVLWVYRERRRAVAALLLVAGIVGMKVTTSFWPLDFLNRVSVLSRSEARADARYAATIVQTKSSGRATVNDVSYRQVFATMKWSGLGADEVCVPYRVEGRVVWPDGVELADNRGEVREFPNYSDLMAALKSLGVDQVPRSPFQGEGNGVTLARLLEADYARLKQAPAEWRGRISVMVGRLEPEWRVPLKVGAQSEQGAARFTVTEVNLDRDQLKLKVHERRPDLPKWKLAAFQGGRFTGWLPQSYALINESRKEAVMANGGGSSSGTNDGFFSFIRTGVYFPGTQGRKEYGSVDRDEWLGGAELIRFRFVEERRVFVDARVPLTYTQ